MARKQRQRRRRNREPTLVNFAQDDVRSAFQKAMLSDVELLGVIADHAQMYKDGDGINAFSGQERLHIQKAVDEIRMAQRRLRALGRRSK